jgi:hypothetical protein
LRGVTGGLQSSQGHSWPLFANACKCCLCCCAGTATAAVSKTLLRLASCVWPVTTTESAAVLGLLFLSKTGQTLQDFAGLTEQQWSSVEVVVKLGGGGSSITSAKWQQEHKHLHRCNSSSVSLTLPLEVRLLTPCPVAEPLGFCCRGVQKSLPTPLENTSGLSPLGLCLPVCLWYCVVLPLGLQQDMRVTCPCSLRPIQSLSEKLGQFPPKPPFTWLAPHSSCHSLKHSPPQQMGGLAL